MAKSKKYIVTACEIHQDEEVYKKGSIFTGKVTKQLLDGSIEEYKEPKVQDDKKGDDLLK